jgi:CubicO group peptidase (beta-lactamase class C family)
MNRTLRILLAAWGSVVVTACHAPAAPPKVAPTRDAEATAQAPSVALEPERVFADQPPAAFRNPAERKAMLEAQIPWLRKHFRKAFDDLELPSLAVGLVIDDHLAGGFYYGARSPNGQPVDGDTVYRIGSITKTFTSAVILSLRDEGKLELDAPAQSYLPALGQLAYGSHDTRPLTVGELLTHSSGLPRLGDFDYTRTDRGPTKEEILRSLEGFELARTPGVKPVYSNLGFSLLGLLAESVAGRPYRELVQDRLLDPLGMTSTVWDEQAVAPGRLAVAYEPDGKTIVEHWKLGASEPGGGLYSTVHDLARFAAFQLDAWPARNGDEQGPLARATRRESHTPRAFESLVVEAGDGLDAPTHARATSIGFAWHVDHDCELEPIVWHGGGTEAYRAALYLLPRHGVALIALTNSEVSLHGSVRSALHRLAARGALPSRVEAPSRPVMDAAARVLGWMDSFDEKAYRAGVTETFFEAVAPSEIVPLLQNARQRHGACRVGGARQIGGPRSATLQVPCERGGMEFNVTVDKAGRMAGFFFKSEGLPPTPATLQAAERVIAMIHKDTVRRCRALLDTPQSCGRVEPVVAPMRAAGTCALVDPSGDGERRLVSGIRCGDARYRLTIRVGAKDPSKLETILFAPEQEASPCHP